MSSALLVADPDLISLSPADPLNFTSIHGDVSAKEEGDVVVYQFRNRRYN